MKTVAQFSIPSEAHGPLSLIRSAGINAVLRDEATVQVYWFYSQAIGGVRLDVPDEDHNNAQEILELVPSEPGLVFCPTVSRRM